MHARASAAVWVVALMVAARAAVGAEPGETPDGAEPAASTAPAAAEVRIHGKVEESVGLEDILRDLLAHRAALTVSKSERIDAAQVLRGSRGLPDVGNVVARVWVELDDAGQVSLYVADAAGQRILVRRIERGAAHREVVLESVARVIATAIEALLQGDPIGVPREQVVPPPPPSPATPSATARAVPPASGARQVGLRWGTGAFYGAQLFAPKLQLLHGPGVSLTGAFGSGRLRPGATLTGQLWLPQTVHDAGLELGLFSASPRLLASADYLASAGVKLSAGLGGGIDITHARPTAEAGGKGVHPAAATTLATAQLRAAFGVSFRVAGGLAVALTGAVDVDLSGTSYVVNNAANQGVFLRPWAARPGLMLGVSTP